MTPVSDLSVERLVFQSPGSWRWLGGFVACVGLAAIAATSAVPGFPHRLSLLIQLIGAFVAACGIMLYLWQERLRLDLRERKFDFFRGIGSFGRFVQGNVTDFNRITLHIGSISNVYGEEQPIGTICLDSATRELKPAIQVREEDARALAYRISGAIGINVDEIAPQRQRSRARAVFNRVAALSGWVGMIAVIATVALTASRKSPRQINGQGLFPSFRRPSVASDYQKGVELYAQGDYKGSEEALKRAIAQFTFFPNAYNELAYALAEQGKLSDAMNAAKKALEQSPISGDILDTVAEMHQRRGEYKEAADYYERALRQPMNQGPCQTHAKYGETLVALGRTKEAVWHLEAAIADNSQVNAEWHDRAAVALAKIRGLPAPSPTRRIRPSGVAAPI